MAYNRNLTHSELAFATIKLEIVLAKSLENLTESTDKFLHCRRVNYHVIDRNSDSCNSERDLLHHSLKRLACIAKAKGSTLKPKTTTWRDKRCNITRFLSLRKLIKTTLYVYFREVPRAMHRLQSVIYLK